MSKLWGMLVILALMAMPFIFAVDFNQQLSASDKSTFDGILEPVMKVYNFVKYAATVLAVLYLLFAAVTFIMSANDQAKRESAKQMALYVIIGLILIWVAPLIVQFMVS